MFLQKETYIKFTWPVFPVDSAHRIRCPPQIALRSAPRPPTLLAKEAGQAWSFCQCDEDLEALQAEMSKIWELWFRCIHNSHKKPCILTSIFSLFYVCPPVFTGFPPHSENQNRTWNWIVKHSVEVWCSFSNTWRRLGIPRVVYATGQQGVEYITKMPVRTGTRTGHSWRS